MWGCAIYIFTNITSFDFFFFFWPWKSSSSLLVSTPHLPKKVIKVSFTFMQFFQIMLPCFLPRTTTGLNKAQFILAVINLLALQPKGYTECPHLDKPKQGRPLLLEKGEQLLTLFCLLLLSLLQELEPHFTTFLNPTTHFLFRMPCQGLSI